MRGSLGYTCNGRGVRPRRHLVWALVVIAAIACVLAAAGGAAGGSQGSLALSATFAGTIKGTDCPPSVLALPGKTECYPVQGTAQHAASPPLGTVSGVPGLGRTTLTGTVFLNFPLGDQNPCRRLSLPDGTLQVADKGGITFTAADSGCQAGTIGGSVSFSLPFTVTGGSGTYAGATGSGTIKLQTDFGSFQKSTLTGTLTVPGLAFDTTAPTITGTTNKVVTISKHARGARVHYTITAKDDTDGSVPVTCSPRSGALFRLGRTRVRCATTDSSANSAGSHFTITVKSR